MFAVSGDFGGCLSIINIRNGSQNPPIRSGRGQIVGVFFIDNGKHIISGTSTGDIMIWSIESGNLEFHKRVDHSIKEPIYYMKISPDEKYVAIVLRFINNGVNNIISPLKG